MMETKLAKIEHVKYGHGGYDDAMFGLSVTLSGKGWGISDFRGHWQSPPSSSAQWTEDDRRNKFADDTIWLIGLLKQAGVSDVAALKGVPVEVTLDGNMLKSWRILEEVL